MAFDEPGWRSEKIAWRFCRSEEDGEVTRVFGNLPDGAQAKLLKLVDLEPDEVPAVATYKSGTEWMMITSDRVIWSSLDGVRTLPLTEVRDATVLMKDLAAAGGKSKVEQVTLVTRYGRTFPIIVEPARPPLEVPLEVPATSIGARRKAIENLHISIKL